MNLNQVTVPSLDLQTSVAFYQHLGLQLIVLSLPHYARFTCPDGDATFSIHLVEKLPVGEGVMVYFECADVDREVALLAAKGIYAEEAPSDKPWLWREARLRDPDGNRVILFHAGSNRKDPPWKLL